MAARAPGQVADSGELPSGPTVAPPAPDSLNSALVRNIGALRERRRTEALEARAEERIARAVTRFVGSMRFVYLHLLLYGGWIAANLGVIPGLAAWDPTFVALAMIASVEAIFVSTFVLISQNRMMAAADRRDDLDLQINLLAEHEVTKLVRMVRAIGDRLGIEEAADWEVKELERDVAPEAVLEVIDQTAVRTTADRPRRPSGAHCRPSKGSVERAA